MDRLSYILIPLLVLAAILLATGRWRLVFAPFRIPAGRLTVDRLGLMVPAADAGRVNAILGAFAGGFNAMLTGASWSHWQRYCDSLPILFQPFAHEGAAMGFTVRRLFRASPADFEASMVKPRAQMRYLYYVGLGFWSGMRNHSPRRLARMVAGLDPLHGYLCYDGYGFKHAFFDYPKNPGVFAKFAALEGYARHAAYHGVGRAFWFLYMGDHERLIDAISSLGEYACDAAAGVGLAAVFVNPDQLCVALDLGPKLPPKWHAHFHLGMCFALKARSINDPEQFERDVARLERGVRDAALAGVRECDRIELRVRAERGKDGYRRWRGLVTEWMAEHLEFPLAGTKSSTSTPRPEQPAAT